MKRFIIYTLFILVVTSCGRKEVIDQAHLNTPVVESYLVAGGGLTVTLHLPVALNDDVTTPTYINNATVVIYENDIPKQLKFMGNGVYEDTTTKVKMGYTYKLSFVYNGLTVTAQTVVPSNPVGFAESASVFTIPQFGSGVRPSFPTPITLTWTNNNQDYYMIAAKYVDTLFTAINTDTTENRPRFSRPPTQSNTTNLSFNLFSYYGNHHLYLYKVNQEYVDLFKSSGTSSLNLTNPPTNITNGYGIFTSFGVDSLVLLVNK